MNEASTTPPPVPDEQPAPVLGEQLAATPVPPTAPGQASQVLADLTRVVADFSGRHLRSSEASPREILARIPKSSGAVHHSGSFALGTAK